jgi:hypothetical protein
VVLTRFCLVLAALYRYITTTDAMMQQVRTTVTLEPDVEALIRVAMRERGLTFKEAVNEAIRAGMTAPSPAARPPLPAHDMGEPLVDVTKALRLAGDLEDQELADRLVRGA